tara:strand:- start:175 stop:363 length:189 start_codon:yes stop_codon:yes gene_type:complete
MFVKGEVKNDGSGDYYFVPENLIRQFNVCIEYDFDEGYEMPDGVIYLGRYPDAKPVWYEVEE